MLASRVEIRVIPVEAALPVRRAGLRPGESLDSVRIEDDAEGLHLRAFLEGELVSVASLFVRDGKAQFRKFATLPALQGRGIGGQLLKRMIAKAREGGATEFWCNARLDALSIYQRAGLRPVGEVYEKEGRVYQRMNLPL